MRKQPPVIDALLEIDGVEQVDWFPETEPDPGNPHERRRNSIVIVPEEEDKGGMKDISIESKKVAAKYDFNVDDVTIFDDVVKLWGPER